MMLKCYELPEARAQRTATRGGCNGIGGNAGIRLQ